MARGRWTQAALLKELRRLILSPNVHLEHCDLHDCAADAAWGERGGHIFIRVDVSQTGEVTAVVHELLHYVLREVLPAHFAYDVEEEMVAGLERALYDGVINKSRYRHGWWRRQVRRRLAEGE